MDSMKSILLAPKGKRILAALVDLLMLFGLSALLFGTAVFPHAYNRGQVEENGREILSLYEDSSLFVVAKGQYAAKSALGSYDSLEDLYEKDALYEGEVFHVSLTKDLYSYYTEKSASYGGANLTKTAYESEILKLGSEESNIASYQEEEGTFSLLDEAKSSQTVSYFLSRFEAACRAVASQGKIASLTSENQKLLAVSFVWFLPVLFGFSLVLDLLLPLCLPEGKTLGKLFFHLGVISEAGYRVKRSQLFPRFLAYFFLELCLGILTIGGLFLISYTMFVFSKKRQCLHDRIAKTCVIQSDLSFYFDSPKEEASYYERHPELSKKESLEPLDLENEEEDVAALKEEDAPKGEGK